MSSRPAAAVVVPVLPVISIRNAPVPAGGVALYTTNGPTPPRATPSMRTVSVACPSAIVEFSSEDYVTRTRIAFWRIAVLFWTSPTTAIESSS